MRSLCLTDAEARQVAETGECEIRRVIKPQPGPGLLIGSYFGRGYPTEFVLADPDGDPLNTKPLICPLGQPGEQRWCKEKWGPDLVTGYMRPASTMPRRASRFTVEILDVKAEHGELWEWVARVKKVE